MKYLLTCLIALPFLTSCEDQTKPVSQVQVENPSVKTHHYKVQPQSAPQKRIQHSHSSTQNKEVIVHEKEVIVRAPVPQTSRVIVTSQTPQNVVPVQPKIHKHETHPVITHSEVSQNQAQLHEHTQPEVVIHPSATGPIQVQTHASPAAPKSVQIQTHASTQTVPAQVENTQMPKKVEEKQEETTTRQDAATKSVQSHPSS